MSGINIAHSPKYQKFKIDVLPLISDFRQDWTYKDLIPYYEKRYGKKIRPVSRRSDCDIPDTCSCPRCDAPKHFLYKNNGSKGQLAYYNFLRPHKHNNYKVLNEVEILQGADNMPGKWQLLIFLGQQTILNMQKSEAAAPERSCCQ